ncbi:MAG: Fe-S cluster assembly ATPase SufC [Armatimonadetes bacterium 13_1_20CM_4_65_7]|nr:MAG: Fe-S cluster assembly ATPase SufC [Armatimonadetes bacterium 13_1_20CM_4_65_7]
MADLEIRDLTVQVEDKVILKGANLTLSKGEVHALMGPNGSGKSTLANVLMGNPFYQVVKGEVLYKGQDLLAMSPDERARRGLFIAFQYPVSIPGVTMSSFLRTAVSARRGYDKELMPVGEFQKLLKQKMDELKIEPAIVSRYVNEGFSGGEKKRAEILQMAMLEPEIAIMDERILHFIKPSYVHVMFDGRFVVSGGPDLAEELEQSGYEGIKAQFEVIAAEVQAEGAVRRAGKVFWVAH